MEICNFTTLARSDPVKKSEDCEFQDGVRTNCKAPSTNRLCDPVFDQYRIENHITIQDVGELYSHTGTAEDCENAGTVPNSFPIFDLNIFDLNIFYLNIFDLNIFDLNIFDLNIFDLNIFDQIFLT